jgi:hypothetical protein
LINADFEVAETFIKSENPLTLLTNIPYGERSSKYIDDRELMQVYVRFGKFLRKKMNRFESVYVIAPENSDKILKGFICLSDLPWEKILDFNNQGIKVSLFKLLKPSV